MRSIDLPRQVLYESVKKIAECESAHIHLPQQKLFTLYSIAFQYFLYLSTKKPGHYIIRVEDSPLLDKLYRKSKDEVTRKLMHKITLPRRMSYGQSTFHLDFFNISTWNVTSELPKEKIMGALIVKNTSPSPLRAGLNGEEQSLAAPISGLSEDYFLTSLLDAADKTITLAFDCDYSQYALQEIYFPFIRSKDEEAVSGVKVSSSIDLSKIQD